MQKYENTEIQENYDKTTHTNKNMKTRTRTNTQNVKI